MTNSIQALLFALLAISTAAVLPSCGSIGTRKPAEIVDTTEFDDVGSTDNKTRTPPTEPKVTAGPKTEKREALQEWHGKISIDSGFPSAPYGYVKTASQWKKVWAEAGRGSSPPAVDFNRDLILVLLHGDPNSLNVREIELDRRNGKLTYGRMATMAYHMNPQTRSYLFVRVRREGVRFVNGWSIADIPKTKPGEPPPFPSVP